MNLSVQNYIMNKNTNCTLMKRRTFKGKTQVSYALAGESEILEKIKALPKNIFEEKAEFLKFYKSISLTPKISKAIKKRLIEVRQTKKNSDNALKNFIELNKRVVEGYKCLLNNCRQLSKSEIAEITAISLDAKLPQGIRDTANELLEKNTRMKLGLY